MSRFLAIIDHNTFGASAPVRELAPHAYERRSLRASANSGGSCFTQRRGCRGQKLRLTTIDIAEQSLPCVLDWAGAEGSHRRTPGREVPHQSERPGAGRFGPVSNETLRSVHQPEQQIPKLTGGSETRKVAATSVYGTLQKTPETSSHCQSVLPAHHCISQKLQATTSWTPPRISPRFISASVRTKGWYAVQLSSGGTAMGRARRLMGYQQAAYMSPSSFESRCNAHVVHQIQLPHCGSVGRVTNPRVGFGAL